MLRLFRSKQLSHNVLIEIVKHGGYMIREIDVESRTNLIILESLKAQRNVLLTVYSKYQTLGTLDIILQIDREISTLNVE